MMKKQLKVITAFLLCLTSIFSFSSYKSVIAEKTAVVIANSGFEEKERGGVSFGKVWYKPTSWSAPSYLLYSFVEDVSVSGQSIKVTADSEQNFVSQSINVVSNKTYTFGYKCLAESENSPTAIISIKVYDAQGENFSTHTNSVIVNSLDWTDVSVTFDTDERASSVDITITIGGKVCYIDEVFGYYEEMSFVTTHTGASLRLVKETPGIRFHGSVEKETFDAYKKKFGNVSAGMLITTEQNLVGITEFTVEALKNRAYTEVIAEKWYNQDTSKTDGFYGFYCAVIKIREKNIDKKFCARAFVKYEENGQTKYVYGNYDNENNARSIKEIATLAKASNTEYSEEQIKIIDYFANFVYNGE